MLKRRLADSLSEVDSALAQWRTGDLSVFEAHGEVLRHVGRAEMVAEQVGEARSDASGLLRQAFDCGIVTRQDFVDLVGKAPEAIDPAPTEPPPPQDLPPKKQVIEELLAEGPILIHINANDPSASVPPQFNGDSRLVLRFGYQLTPPIPDLVIDEEGVIGTLTFGGQPHRCVLPWTAIYAVVAEANQEGMVWPDDLPAVVSSDLGHKAGPQKTPKRELEPIAPPDPSLMPSADEIKRGSHLKLVE